MSIAIATNFLGGIGLFLLGMRLMTQGLRLAAGSQLRNILGRWTKTPTMGIFSGFLITALVQSSSAITVATIGFVNAGLMTLTQSVGVIFGSNVGTTITGWIVAAVGLDVNIKALALPLIGLGAILRLTGANTRREPLGDALAGFGLFFLGIEILEGAFHGLGSGIDLGTIGASSNFGIPIYLGIGFGLTLLMQSSSAAMALVITAAIGGVIDIRLAAAAVIGTNIGTTSTAAFAVLGATVKAKKVATAHIIFNLTTGIAAIIALPGLLKMVSWMQSLVNATAGPGMTLALFHTTFNILGVLIFLPGIPKLVRFLDRRIGRDAYGRAKPRYLDNTVLQTPSLALDALFMEIGRLGEMSRMMIQKALISDCLYPDMNRDRKAIEALSEVIREFCVQLQKRGLPENIADGLPRMLRMLQYYRTVGDIIHDLAQIEKVSISPDSKLNNAMQDYKDYAKDILNLAHTPCLPEFGELEARLEGLTDTYHKLKKVLLEEGADGTIDLEAMVQELEYYSRTRRMIEQAVKGTAYWAGLRSLAETCRNAAQGNEFTWKTQQ